jgi:predicted RNase H-like HicB family nuclease
MTGDAVRFRIAETGIVPAIRTSSREDAAYAGSPSVKPVPYDDGMLRYHVAFHLPRAAGEMVVAEALDFPGAVTQGFDLADARSMIGSAMEDLAQCLLEEGKPLPAPDPDAAADADLIELVPLSVHVGASRV